MKDVRLNKNTREWDNIIITTVFERAQPGTKLTETTNDRLPSRTTDTESDYQNSEWLQLIEKRENRARARIMTSIQPRRPGAHARTTPNGGSMEVINGCSAAGLWSGMSFTVKMDNNIVHVGQAGVRLDVCHILLLLYE